MVKFKALLSAALGLVSLCPCLSAKNKSPRLTPDNIDEVIASMTLQEKARVVVGSGWGNMLGIRLASSETITVAGAAGTTRSVSRLGIPAVVLSDGPAGLRINPKGGKRYCTGFPVGTLLACTWNEALVGEVGAAMGHEVLEYGADVILAPGMNLMRNPLCGRNFEYYSEDPLLGGKTAAAMIRGIQGNGVGTSAKHFAANNQEMNRLGNDARVDERTLRELYLRGFEIAVREGKPWTVMSSYNKLNGEFTQEDHWLLTDVLREEWGFEGLVMTDWTGKRNTPRQISAGNDLMEPGSSSQIKEIVKAVRRGELAENELDICVRRVLELVVKTPRFASYEYSNSPNLRDGAAVARRAACEGMVLLENRDALPFDGIQTAAVYGTASYDFIAGGTGSGNVNKAYVVNVADGLRGAGVAPDATIERKYLEYLKKKANREANFVMLGQAPWKEPILEREMLREEAGRSDVAILTISRQAGESQDRAVEDDFLLKDIELSNLKHLCDEYHAAGKKVVVILNVGGVVETASWKHLPDAILCVWGAGQEGGNSIADVLTGVCEPSGRLSMTWPMRYEDIPSSTNFPAGVKSEFKDLLSTMRGAGEDKGRKDIDYTDYAEGLNVGYRYFCTSGVDVSYPFGYGLGYSIFEFSDAKVTRTGDDLSFSVTVRNVGTRQGKEVVQLYVSAPSGGLSKPEKELRAFSKTALLAPGEKTVVKLAISVSDLASFNPASHAWETSSGAYKAYFSHDALTALAEVEFAL